MYIKGNSIPLTTEENLLLHEATVSGRTGDFEDALASLRKIQDSMTERVGKISIVIAMNIADCLTGLGDIESAIAWYKEGIRLAAEFGTRYLNVQSDGEQTIEMLERQRARRTKKKESHIALRIDEGVLWLKNPLHSFVIIICSNGLPELMQDQIQQAMDAVAIPVQITKQLSHTYRGAYEFHVHKKV